MPWKKDSYGNWEYKLKWKNKKLANAINELLAWLPDEPQGYRDIVFNILGAVPGGDLMYDLGYDKYVEYISWKELDMLGNLIDAIQSKEDVKAACEAFYGPPDDDDY